jgi:hypothetical protein
MMLCTHCEQLLLFMRKTQMDRELSLILTVTEGEAAAKRLSRRADDAHSTVLLQLACLSPPLAKQRCLSHLRRLLRKLMSKADLNQAFYECLEMLSQHTQQNQQTLQYTTALVMV